MKKAGFKSPLKILAATSVTIFSLLSVFTSTAAWFDSQRNLKNGANQMEISPVAGVLKSVGIYNHSGPVSSDTGSTYTFTKVGSVSFDIDGMSATGVLETSFPMNTYSLMNPYQPVLFLFEMNENVLDQDINLLAKLPNNHDFLVETNSSGEAKNPLESSGNNLSSAIQWRTRTFSSNPFGENDSCEISTASLSAYGHFFDMDADGSPDSTSLSTIKSKPEKTIYRGNTDNAVTHLAVIFDYYAAALEFIYTLNIGSDVFSDFESTIGFICDWSLML